MTVADKRMLVLGNGPSLKPEHFAMFSGVATLGMNAAYRYWERIGWYPDVYCCLDDQVVVSHSAKIAEMVTERRCKRFFLAPHILKEKPDLAARDEVVFLPQLAPGVHHEKACRDYALTHRPSRFFRSSAPSKLTTGSYAVRFAAYCGYDDIGLLGIDCRYVEVIKEAAKVGGIVLEIAETPRRNSNYFFDDYQRAGDRYNIPNPAVHGGNLHLQAFAALKDDFARRAPSVAIVNCALESELRTQGVFPYVPAEAFVSGRYLSALAIPLAAGGAATLTAAMARWDSEEAPPYEAAPATPHVGLHLVSAGAPPPEIESVRKAFAAHRLDRYFTGLDTHAPSGRGLRQRLRRRLNRTGGGADIRSAIALPPARVRVIEPPEGSRAPGWLAAMEARAPIDNVIRSLPPYLQHPIFLPTARIPRERQLTGLLRVKDLYEGGLDSKHRPRLRALKAARQAHRCFIIGNGPSLAKTDLAKLKGEATFATNGFFLKMPDLDWTPTYYVVEDHLVAEDRADEINRLAGPTKLFPANLAYALETDEKAIFFDHRPRTSFPRGFDFSFEADRNTFAGGTVTFTCMQLAAYLGYEEIYLIGVDADYAIPRDATLSGPGRVKEIDMASDDPNHFHPDYFGKGKRWHEPNVDVMLGAYAEARRACEARGVKIVNATAGGKLEIFPRADYDALFAPEAPRLLLIDHTLTGDGSATGEVKAAILEEWPADRLMQIYQRSAHALGLRHGARRRRFSPAENGTAPANIARLIREFDPELILYRPAAMPSLVDLHAVAMDVVSSSSAPLAVWIMDDWPAAIEGSASPLYAMFAGDWRLLVEMSSWRLSIGEQMSRALEARYGLPFEPFANGIDPSHWPAPQRRKGGPTLIRYAGSLAENMTLASVLRVAEAVERLAREGLPVKFEINTRPFWRERSRAGFVPLTHTTFTSGDLSRDEYRKWLSEADINVIAYNFDNASATYVRHSVANKLPECLASGAALLAHGPADAATLAFLAQEDCGVRVTGPDEDGLAAAIRDLASSPEKRAAVGDAGRRLAFEAFDIRRIRVRFLAQASAAARAGRAAARGCPRTRSAHVDETRVVARLMAERRAGSVMIDVGAHQGSALAPFETMGWRIFAFEPDPANREKLVRRFGASPNVSIDPRAIGEEAATDVPFFTSGESTGISGLHAFHESHVKAGAVDVTTLSAVTATHGLKHVDFLKIDVEGHDFSVLKGAPWGSIRPDVIECEFEDAKTVPLGHTYREIAEFLGERGYSVYLSEWHPIVRYGIRHQWRRVVRYPAEMARNAWGNILAFREDPGLEAIAGAFAAELEEDARVYHAARTDARLLAAHAEASGADPGGVTLAFAEIKRDGALLPARSFYVRAVERLHEFSPGLYSLLRGLKQSAGGVFGRR